MAVATKTPPKAAAPQAGTSIRLPRLSDYAPFAQASDKFDSISLEYTAAMNKLAALQAEAEAFPDVGDALEFEAQILAASGSPDELAAIKSNLERRKALAFEIAQLEPRVKVYERALKIASDAVEAARPKAMLYCVRQFDDAVLRPVVAEAVAAFVKAGELMRKVRSTAEVGEQANLRTGFDRINWDDWNPRTNGRLFKVLSEFVIRGIVDESHLFE